MSSLTTKPKLRTAAGKTASSKAKASPVKGPRWKNAAATPDDQYRLKRQVVIAEAAKTFGRHGAANVSLDQIAAALNVTKPALYYYIKNKQELIYECHELVMRSGDQVLQDAIASQSTGYGRITTFIKNYVALLTDELGAPAILHDLSAMSQADQKKIVLRRRKFDQQLRELVEAGILDGSIAQCDSKLAVFWFMSAVSSIPQWYRTEGSLHGEQIADAFIRFLSAGIQSRAAG
ncbi:MAG: TetR/AcrR family transcriptional regulator [Alcaligenaceae bacterium]|nr:MAG: TetR/AcrR family transcriptional regulator [Alcaligenaceae bacterium]